MTLEGDKFRLTSLLLDAGCLKFGQFVLKSGAQSAYYLDLRYTTMHRKLKREVLDAIKKVITTKGYPLSDFAIVGVPYGVVPVAAIVAHELDVDYYPVRKEAKGYGNEKDTYPLIDKKIILIEDVMSTGASIIETLEKLGANRVTDVLVIVDREAGGDQNMLLNHPDISLCSILKASDILELRKNGMIPGDN